MGIVSLPELERLAADLGKGRFGEPVRRGLDRAFEEFAFRRRPTIAPVAFTADGRSFRSLYAALADPSVRFDPLEVALAGPVEPRPGWEFLVPFQKLELRKDGSAELVPSEGGAPRRAIARLLLREHFLFPEPNGKTGPPGARPELPPLLGTVGEELALCRTAPLVPLSVAFLIYLPEERIRLELDLVRGALLADPRAGRLSAARRVLRTSRIAWALDHLVGSGQLSLLAGRCLETLVESNGLTSSELARLFGGVRSHVDQAVRALVEKQVVSYDPRTGFFHARLEAFLPSPAEPGTERTPPAIDPALRSSVQELMAAAESQATCPLCGRPLSPNSTWILCDDCARTVGVEPG